MSFPVIVAFIVTFRGRSIAHRHREPDGQRLPLHDASSCAWPRSELIEPAKRSPSLRTHDHLRPDGPLLGRERQVPRSGRVDVLRHDGSRSGDTARPRPPATRILLFMTNSHHALGLDLDAAGQPGGDVEQPRSQRSHDEPHDPVDDRQGDDRAEPNSAPNADDRWVSCWNPAAKPALDAARYRRISPRRSARVRRTGSPRTLATDSTPTRLTHHAPSSPLQRSESHSSRSTVQRLADLLAGRR